MCRDGLGGLVQMRYPLAMQELLRDLVTLPPIPVPAAPVSSWWEALCARLGAGRSSFARAVLGGFWADRAGFAFAAGYQAALSSWLGVVGQLASFCVTEDGGAHPAAIQCALSLDEAGGTLTGEKRFATLGAEAVWLFVLASAGEEGGKKDLRLARVRASAPGVSFEVLPALPFTPEIGHASVRFVNARAEAILPGDGFAQYAKPFRTLEDLHVFGALLGHLVQCGRRLAWPRDEIESMLAQLVTLGGLAALPPSLEVAHLALSGALSAARGLVERVAPRWEAAPADERDRWARDRPLLQIAEKARRLRTARAWDALGG